MTTLYNIVVEEIINKTYEIRASSPEEAEEIYSGSANGMAILMKEDFVEWNILEIFEGE